MKFTITITDPDHLAGLTAARERHDRESDTPVGTDAAYVQMVMERACESYGRAYAGRPETIEAALSRVATAEARAEAAEAEVKALREVANG